MDEYKIGDVLRLKGGSPPLTVNFIGSTDGTIECVWFTPEGRAQSATFVSETLEKWPEPLKVVPSSPHVQRMFTQES